MKIKFDLKRYGILGTDPKVIIDKDGNKLSPKTLNTILSLIANKYMYNEIERTGIHYNIFSNITNDYKLYLNYLRTNEVILWTNYEVGKHSRRYYFTDIFKKYAVIDSMVKDNNDPKQEKLDNYLIPIDNYIKKQLKKDFQSLEYFDKPITKKLKIDSTTKQVYNFKSYLSTYLNFQRFRNNDLYYNWKSGRLYTNFCSCSKETRLNNFHFNNDLLYSLDINSSFPLWLTIWCIDKGIDIKDYDFQEFCTDVFTKDKKHKSIIYNTIREKLNKIKDSDNINNDDIDKKAKPFYSLKTAKIEFVKWLNGKPKNNITNNLFKQYYPSIFEIVDRTKYKMYEELVKLETNFMMNIIVKRLYEEIQGIKILTCHDEIYFQEKYLDPVQLIWKEELNKIYDRLPLLKENDALFDGIEEVGKLEEVSKFKPSGPKKDIIWEDIKDEWL